LFCRQTLTVFSRLGIGTDATIAQHIQTIQDRQYVEKVQVEGNQAAFTPTTLGCALVDAYDTIGFPEVGHPLVPSVLEFSFLEVIPPAASGRNRSLDHPGFQGFVDESCRLAKLDCEIRA
jgi:DNA topoisomerase